MRTVKRLSMVVAIAATGFAVILALAPNRRCNTGLFFVDIPGTRPVDCRP